MVLTMYRPRPTPSRSVERLLSEGITENTSKKKQQLRERQGREAAAKDFEAKKRAAAGLAPEEAAEVLSGDPERPFSRGRAYSSEHYTKHEENE